MWPSLHLRSLVQGSELEHPSPAPFPLDPSPVGTRTRGPKGAKDKGHAVCWNAAAHGIWDLSAPSWTEVLVCAFRAPLRVPVSGHTHGLQDFCWSLQSMGPDLTAASVGQNQPRQTLRQPQRGKPSGQGAPHVPRNSYGLGYSGSSCTPS